MFVVYEVTSKLIMDMETQRPDKNKTYPTIHDAHKAIKEASKVWRENEWQYGNEPIENDPLTRYHVVYFPYYMEKYG